ncbi:MAG: hypothetical protein AMXMBFR48_29550 [Ignavibacteriales bacterium]
MSQTGKVLYVAAHPDDENTAMLAYCANKLGFEAAYLSLTRGDGGQNMFGDEQGTDLGIIRTQELLAARRTDGARQFFTRAYDFGYSKSPAETFSLWNKDSILADVVYVIRSFRPDVVITRFPATGEGGHGHHTASAILAEEAFRLAGRADIYPRQLTYVTPWQPKRLLWNGWGPVMKSRGINPDTLATVDIGEYYIPTGMSFNEIAARSRTMHKSQGFGSSPQRGEQIQHFLHLDGEYVKDDIFNGVGGGWSKLGFIKEIDELFAKAISEYDFTTPEKSVPLLLDIYNKALSQNNLDAAEKLTQLKTLITGMCGVWSESVSNKEQYTRGDTMSLKTSVINRRGVPLKVIAVNNISINKEAPFNKPFLTEHSMVIGADARLINPFWTDEPMTGSIFTISDQQQRILPELGNQFSSSITLELFGTQFSITTPVLFRKNDPVEGETWLEPAVLPVVSLIPEKELYISNNSSEKQISVTLRVNASSVSGNLSLQLPDGWLSTPVEYFVDKLSRDEEKTYSFTIKRNSGLGSGSVGFEFTSGDISANRSYYEISYSHIPLQIVQPRALSRILFTDITLAKQNIGYIPGAGDKVAEALGSTGYTVTSLAEKDITTERLSSYQSIVTGVRLFNTNKNAPHLLEKLLEYVKQGGTLVVQYNTSGELKVAHPGPYPFKISRDRVTDETAEITITEKASPLLSYPNQITAEDFSGWVQERGLYFPSELAPEYKTLLSMSDKGEGAKHSSLIWTRYGKGVFIYTGISFFRQLPAGVPGALRLFVNLIEQK